jgi:6-phosphogluconolactonase
MKFEIFADEKQTAYSAAKAIAEEGRAAIAARGRFLLAVSGGRAPWVMLRALGDEDLLWSKVHVFQVDERVAPRGHPDRNLTHLQKNLLDYSASPPENIHPMPVEASDLDAAAAEYAALLAEVAGSPPTLDLVHLGLGPDGHTASLIPGDAVLTIDNSPVATTRIYQGRRRMTLTYPAINAARRVLWLVTGADKAEVLVRLRDASEAIPAGRISQHQAVVFADSAATALVAAA